jgi:hypothetical protein
LKNQLDNARTRQISIGLYVAIFLWSAQHFGVPVDRIAVTLWILGAFVFANVGKPLRAQRNMLRDWSVFAAMLFTYEYSRGLADQLGVPVQKTLVRDIDRIMFFGADPNVWLQERLNISSQLAWYEYPLAIAYMTHCTPAQHLVFHGCCYLCGASGCSSMDDLQRGSHWAN